MKVYKLPKDMAQNRSVWHIKTTAGPLRRRPRSIGERKKHLVNIQVGPIYVGSIHNIISFYR